MSDPTELCFWQFLIAVRAQQDWFRSIHFKIWALGSVIAIVGLPVATIMTRQDPLKVLGSTPARVAATLPYVTLVRGLDHRGGRERFPDHNRDVPTRPVRI